MVKEADNKDFPYYLADGYGSPRFVRNIDQELKEHGVMVVKELATDKIRIYYKGKLIYG